MGRLENKVSIVTGAALGIGKSCCILIAKEGSKVAVTDVLDSHGQEVVDYINNHGGQAQYWHLDITDEKEVKNVFREVESTFEKIDILVNNAGIVGVNKPTHEITEAEWDHVMAVNVKGVFFCTKHVVPFMKNTGQGSIINLSSIYGLVGAPDLPPYHASKGAVRIMSKTDALLYAADKIRVNSIHPAFIWTPLVESLLKDQGGDIEKLRKNLDDMHPLGHMGEPNDVAYGVIYLASDESKFITGSELVIDGGYTCR